MKYIIAGMAGAAAGYFGGIQAVCWLCLGEVVALIAVLIEE